MFGAVTATWMNLVTLDLPDLAASAASSRLLMGSPGGHNSEEDVKVMPRERHKAAEGDVMW